MNINNSQFKPIIWATVGTILGFVLAGSFGSVKAFVVSVVSAFFAHCLTVQVIEAKEDSFVKRKSRASAYIVCVFVLFGISWIMSHWFSEYVYSQESLHLSIFLALLTPSLMGVWSGINTEKDTYRI